MSYRLGILGALCIAAVAWGADEATAQEAEAAAAPTPPATAPDAPVATTATEAPAARPIPRPARLAGAEQAAPGATQSPMPGVPVLPADAKAGVATVPRARNVATPTVDPVVAGLDRLRGALPPATARVSLSAKDRPLIELLDNLASQASWDLAHTLPASIAHRRMTLILTDSPALQALNAVLQMGKLRGEFNGKLLTIAIDEARSSGEEMNEGDVGSSSNEIFAEYDEGNGLGDNNDNHEKHRHQERVVIGGSLTIGPNETVESAVVIGGTLTVAGRVRHDAVVVAGKLIARPSAAIGGDVVAVAGNLALHDGAIVHGDRISMGGPFNGGLAKVIAALAHGGDISPMALFVFNFVGVLVRALLLFVLAVLLVSFAPTRTQRVREFLSIRPGASIAGGMVLLVGMIPACLLLVVTLVGIPLIPVLLFGLLSLMVIGLTSLMIWVGESVPLFEGRKTPLGAMMIGLVLLTLIGLIPAVGHVALAVLSFMAAGAALLSLCGSESNTPS